MKRMALISATAALLLAGGCSPNTEETDRLRGDLAKQKAEVAESRAAWESERDKLKGELAELRGRIGESKPDHPLGQTVEDLQKRVDKFEKSGDSKTGERLTALEKSVETVKKEAVDAAKAEAAKTATGSTTGMTKEELDAYMTKKAAEDAEANKETKNLADALSRLNISDAEKEAIRQSVIDCKKAQLELLETPTADGRIFAEELIDTFIKIQDGKATQADVGKLFMELVATKVPGDVQGRTYVQAIEEYKQRNKDSIGKLLTPEDQKKLSRAHPDWSEFEVGEGDPFGALYMERMQKYQKSK
ncbi:MAG: hypothetical protein IPP14_12970 [Planctomycetes bacterium]|nr:hypothetical protein [Planctomycetota bacterium]